MNQINRLYITKLTQFMGVVILVASFSFAQAQTDTTKNWRLFPSQNAVNPDIDVNAKTEPVLGDTLDYSQPDGTVEINSPVQIDALNSSLSEKPCIYGYTIQVAVSQQKKVIQDARYKMLKMHPKVPLDAPYIEPNLYLYAGRFYDRNSAYEFKHQIAKHFPNAIVIGPKKLDLPIIEMPLQEESEVGNQDQ